MVEHKSGVYGGRLVLWGGYIHGVKKNKESFTLGGKIQETTV